MRKYAFQIGLAALAVAAFAGGVSLAQADNPHGLPADPNGSCQHSGGGKPTGDCNNEGLPQSEGCLHGQAPNQNPHCVPTETIPPTTPTETTPTETTPTETTPTETTPAEITASSDVKGSTASSNEKGSTASSKEKGSPPVGGEDPTTADAVERAQNAAGQLSINGANSGG